MNVEIPEQRHRGVAGAEVVERHGDTHHVDGREFSHDFWRGIDELRLGDLQVQLRRFQPRLIQSAHHRRNELSPTELRSRHVHGHPALGFRCGERRADSVQHPPSQRVDEARSLGQTNELTRAQESTDRVVPAHESLVADDLAIAQSHDGLELWKEPLPGADG